MLIYYKKSTIYIIVISFFLISGCNSSTDKESLVQENGDQYIFHLKPNVSKNIDAEKQLSNLKIIPLEGASHSYLGGIKKIERDTTTGRWYILGSRRMNAITVFEEDGQFVKRIQHIGRGPGEYQDINDFFLADGDWIELMDGSSQKLLKYDIKSDTLLSERNMPFYAYSFSYLKNGNYVFYKNKQAANHENNKYFNKILVTDEKLNVIRSYFPFELKVGQAHYSVMQPQTLTNSARGILFNKFLADTIYTINADRIQPRYLIDYGPFRFENSNNHQFSSGREKIQYLADHTDEFIMGVSHITETMDMISFNFIYDEDLYTFLYDKAENKPYIIQKMAYGASDIELPKPKVKIGSGYLGFYDIGQLSRISMEKLEDDREKYSQLIKGKIDYQNPVLVTYNFDF